MKNKKGMLLLVIVVLLVGIVLGSQNSVGRSNYFEEAKNNFEEQITEENNNYQSIDTSPSGDMLSKIAIKIDEKINSLLNAILDKLV
jgi:ABC-type cobalt transport system substrate-binding protein